MELIEKICAYCPRDEREEGDRLAMLQALEIDGSSPLYRENLLYHFTVSGLILNRDRNRTLMVHHNIYRSWGWTGGHADGEEDLLAVALREACEETGVRTIRPLSEEIASMEVIPVAAHRKKGRYVNSHLHLNVTYLLEGDEGEPLCACPGENSGVMWIPTANLAQAVSEKEMLPIYEKLLRRAGEL